MRNRAVSALSAIALMGCNPTEVEDSGDTEPVVVDGCRAGSGPTERVAVVNHPYATDATTWEVLNVGADGEISSTGTNFLLGRSTGGRVAFTPDGSIGLVALEGGVLGVFEIEQGVVRVIETSWQGDSDALYVTGVAMHPSGERALVLDSNWRENGGQVAEVAIDCTTGELTQTGVSWPSKLAQAAVSFGTDWLVAADDLGDSTTASVHRLGDDVIATAELFPDASAIVSSIAVSGDLVVLGDYNAYEYGDRLGIGRISGDGITALSTIPNVPDPVDFAFSPDGRSLLVSSGFGDALLALSVGQGSEPIALLGELTYSGGGPALPSAVVVVADLSMAFVAENLGVRRVEFGVGGSMTDLGRFDVGAGTESVVGAIGVQP